VSNAQLAPGVKEEQLGSSLVKRLQGSTALKALLLAMVSHAMAATTAWEAQLLLSHAELSPGSTARRARPAPTAPSAQQDITVMATIAWPSLALLKAEDTVLPSPSRRLVNLARLGFTASGGRVTNSHATLLLESSALKEALTRRASDAPLATTAREDRVFPKPAQLNQETSALKAAPTAQG